MEGKRFTQAIIGGVCSTFFFLMVSCNLIIYLLNLTYLNTFSVFIPIFNSVAFLITIFNIKISKQLQVLLMLFNSYLCFIIYDNDVFYAWGFLLLFIALSYSYGFLESRLKLKIIVFLISFVIIAAIAAYIHRDPYSIFTVLGYFCCIFFSLCFILRDIVSKIIRSDSKMNELESSLNEKELELSKCKETIQFEKDIKTIFKDLSEEIKSLQDENLLLKEKLLSYLDDESLTNSEITENKTILINILKRKLSGLKEIEYEVIAVYYLNKGSLTNTEIGFELNISEQKVKNALYSIFKVLNINSRNQLLNYINNLLRN